MRRTIFYAQLSVSIVLFLFFIMLGATLFRTDPNGYYANLYSEAMGAFATLLIIERWTHIMELRKRHKRRRRAALIAQMREHESASEACARLTHLGWLKDGTLRGAHLARARLRGLDLHKIDLYRADLRSADLREANLTHANLQRTHLMRTSLQKAQMVSADLRHARLVDSDLSGADLHTAHLHGARLRQCNLEHADLSSADLQDAQLVGANLNGADLRGADIRGAVFDAYTILPDGTAWTFETDLTRFTDPAHPQFWRGDGHSHNGNGA